MLIRSQNKESIINFDRVDTVRLSRCVEKGAIREHYQTDVFYETADTFGVLGTYSTQEKAIKVLDMIQNKYLQHMTVDNNGTVFKILERPKVFQMPQDSEVRV